MSKRQQEQRHEEAFMARRFGVALLATGALVIASAIGATSRGVAQDRSGAGTFKLAEAAQTERKKSAPPRTVAPKTVTPKTVTPKTVTPKTVAPKTVAPKTVAPPRTTTSTPKVTPRSTTVTPKQLGTQKAVTTKKTATPKQTVTPKVVTPRTTTLPKTAAPKAVDPSRLGLRTIAKSSTGKATIRGRSYTVWRGTHRVRHGGGWATLAAISTLSVFVFGGASYYPYAYVSATGPYCEGDTEDGCVLEWTEVPTIEGPRLYQCVAYCPWQ
jgi:hypothetical protein